MGIIVQHYTLNDTSKYGQSYKLSTSISKLNEMQTEKRKGSFSAVNKNDAATVEISALAKQRYAESVNEKAQPAATPIADTPKADTPKVPDNNVINNNDKYAGLSNIEREKKELEDYIASHPVDTSIDVLRNGSLSQMAASAVNLDEVNLDKAGKAFTEAFTSAAEDFSDFSMKITYGDYSSNDVSKEDLNFGAIDNMEQMYQSYKDQIKATYSGAEGDKYLSKLDEAYNNVFSEKIIKPIKEAFDDKLTFVQPDSDETAKSITAASTSKQRLEEMVSGYLTNQSIKKGQYETLSNGTQAFYDMSKDTSMWHNTDSIKKVLSDTMDAYSSVKEVKSNASQYQSQKAAADAIAKKISDQYAETVAYQMDKLGLKKNGVDVDLGIEQQEQPTINDYITNTTSGMYTIDFSKIPNLSELMQDK